MDSELNLNQPVQDNDAPLEVGLPEQAAPMPATSVARMTGQASLGMPNLNLPPSDVSRTLSDGGEDGLRRFAANVADFDKQTARIRAITQMAQNRGEKFTQLEAQTIDQMLQTLKPTDPGTVFEEYYAKHYIDNFKKAAKDNPDSVAADMMRLAPKEMEDDLKVGWDLKTKKEIAQYYLDKSADAVHKRTWAGMFGDMAKWGIPGYWEYNVRQSNPATSVFAGGLIGDNLIRQTADHFALSVPEFKKLAETIYQKHTTGALGGNPDLALTYFQALVGQSQLDYTLNEAFSALDVMSLGVLKPIAGIRFLFRNGIKSSIKSGLDKEISKSAVEEATGNVKEAGIAKATQDVVKNLEGSGNAIKESVEGLPSIMKPEIDALNVIGPSGSEANFGRELTNRIKERAVQLKDNLISAIAEGVNVMKLPVMYATDQNVRHMVNTRLRSQIPGTLDNSLLDINYHYNPVDRVHYAEYNLGKHGTELFGSESTAKAFARANLREKAVGSYEIKAAEGPPSQISVKAKPATLDDFVALQGEVRLKDGREIPVAQGAGTIWGPNNTEISKNIITAFKQKGVKGHTEDWVNLTSKQPSAVIGQKGAGFYIKITKPVNEDLFRDILLKEEGNITPASWLTSFSHVLGAAKTPEETLGVIQNMNRKIATVGPNRFDRVVTDTLQEVRDLRKRAWIPGTTNKKRWAEWNEATNSARFNDPVTGKWRMHDTISDVVDHWQRKLGRLPDEQELEAYFSYQRSQALLREMKNLNARSEKLRVGAETHTIKFLDNRIDTEAKRSIPEHSVTVDGTVMKEIPSDMEGVAILHQQGGWAGARLRTSINIRGKAREALNNAIDTQKGFLIKLTNPEEQPLRFINDEFKGAYPKYVYATKIESKPLAWNQVKEYGVPDVAYNHYVVQPIVQKDKLTGLARYIGDRSVAAFNIRAMGKDFANKLDTIRQFLAGGAEDAAREYHARSGMQMDFNDIHNLFKAEGDTPARLNLNERIQLVPSNNKTVDMHRELQDKYGRNFRDITKEDYSRYLISDRDPDHLWAIENSGTKDNPLYNVVPTQRLDPMPSLNRALNKAINSSFLEDYKISAIEHWMQEAKGLLNIDEKSLMANPIYFFHNPKWLAGAPAERINQLEVARTQIKQFLGVQDKTDTLMHAASQQIADMVYGAYGPKSALVASWAIPKLTDPFTFIRSVTFHDVLGMFAIPQLWKQMNGYATIYGVAGAKYAGPGTRAAMLHEWSRINSHPNILAHLDKLASEGHLPGTSGYKPGEFAEAFKVLGETGWEHVGGEYALRDSPFARNFIGNEGQKFLNAGAVFFREGEKFVRLGAWYTAFKEFREARPLGALSQADKLKILNRADLLAANMTRASNATVNRGIMSIPTQFLTYQLRTMELFMGKRLSSMERMRMFGWYAGLYGLPIAFNLGGFPVGDYIHKWATEDGYHVGDSYINSAITEGIPSALMALITEKVGGKAEWYDVGGMGLSGFTQLRDALRSDRPWWNLMIGAAGNTVVNTFASMDSFTKAMLYYSGVSGQEYPFKMEDFIAPFKEIRSVESGIRLKKALELGHWMSKNEDYLYDVGAANASFMTVTGLSPVEVRQLAERGWTRAEEKVDQDAAIKKFVHQMRRSMVEANNQNYDQAQDYIIRAFSDLKMAGLPNSRYAEAISLAAEGHESLVDRAKWDFATKNVPEAGRLFGSMSRRTPEQAYETYRQNLINKGQ